MTKKKNNMMTDYEETCMWMSYRYAIGRSTIAAHYHAKDIAANCYKRMTNDRSEFTAKDIRDQIGNILRIDKPSFYEEQYSESNDPFGHFVGYINGKTKLLLAKIKKVVYTSNGKYDVEYGERFEFFYPHFNDLLVWANLASLFDIKNHKYCKLIDDSICEYFEGYIDRSQYDTDDSKTIYNYEKIKIPVSKFSKARDSVYIPDESIKEDNINI